MFDPGIYIAALIGGELIDLIDHPLHQFVFERDDSSVIEARSVYKKEGLRSAINYLLKREDEHAFNRLRLHNVFSLTMIAIAGILASLYLPGQVYSFVMLGAFILHMLADIFGDFKLLGHFDNWLWILPPKALKWLGQIGSRMVWIVLFWWIDILLSFILVSLRSIGGLYNPSLINIGLAYAAYQTDWFLYYFPLSLLLIYFMILFVLVNAGAHKIKLESLPEKRGNRVRFTFESLKSRNSMSKFILSMQSNQTMWIFILTCIIALTLVLEPWPNLNPVVIFYTPVVLALIFGTLFHPTIGEFGGVQGVLLSVFLNFIFSRYFPGAFYQWPQEYGLMLFASACVAWILGLLGGIVLRDYKSLSLTIFVIKLSADKNLTNETAHHYYVDVACHGMETGYEQAHKILFGDKKTGFKVSDSPVDYLITPQVGFPTYFGDYRHFTIKDTTRPVLQDMAYILCANRLSSFSKKLGKFGLLPTLPRSRFFVKRPEDADILWNNGTFYWDRANTPVTLPSCDNVQSWVKAGTRMGLIKTLSEFYDDLVTKQLTFQTDLHYFTSEDDLSSVTLCGICRSKTSTKEYTTVESECYASLVVDHIIDIARKIPGITVAEKQTARIVFPQISYDDFNTIDELSHLSIIPLNDSPCFSKNSADLLIKTLCMLPGTGKKFDLTADIKRRFTVLVGQLGISFSAILGFLYDKLNMQQWISQLFR